MRNISPKIVLIALAILFGFQSHVNNPAQANVPGDQNSANEHSAPSFLKKWKNFFGGQSEIQKRENDKFIIYEINFEDQAPESLQVVAKDGLLRISGKIEQTSSDDRGNFRTSSRYVRQFSQSFPLPENVNEAKLELENRGLKVLVKIPKTSVVSI